MPLQVWSGFEAKYSTVPFNVSCVLGLLKRGSCVKDSLVKLEGHALALLSLPTLEPVALLLF